jgi:hypothetical protein
MVKKVTNHRRPQPCIGCANRSDNFGHTISRLGDLAQPALPSPTEVTVSQNRHLWIFVCRFPITRFEYDSFVSVSDRRKGGQRSRACGTTGRLSSILQCRSCNRSSGAIAQCHYYTDRRAPWIWQESPVQSAVVLSTASSSPVTRGVQFVGHTTFDDTVVQIYDTVGLGDPSVDTATTIRAVEQRLMGICGLEDGSAPPCSLGGRSISTS